MSIIKKSFGLLPNGKEASLFSLSNSNGMTVDITNVAAAVVSINMPDRDGKIKDVVLGYDKPEKYMSKGAYHGAVVGRMANRIEDAVFSLNGKEYRLKPNHQGRHMLHGGEIGLDSKLYDANIEGENTLALSCVMPDGEDGFPGTVTLKVTYTLTERGGLVIHYLASSDADTVINLTNHSYFNLSGQDSGKILDHILQINAESYNPLDENGMVYGEVSPVRGTMDFREPKTIGRDIEADCAQLKIAKGYDHNYVLDVKGKTPILAASVYDEESGRYMEVYTNSPGILLYTGNYLAEHKVSGKGGRLYQAFEGLCLETNFPPNALKYPNLPQPVLRRGEVYDYTTEYRFGIRK